MYCLPIYAKLHLAGKNHPSEAALARQMLQDLLGWFPERRLVLIGDGAYSTSNLLADLDPRVTYVGVMRADAAIYDPVVPKQPKSKRGRKATKGSRFPNPKEAVKKADSNRSGKGPWVWKTVKATCYGVTRKLQVLSFQAVWPEVRGLLPILVVLVRDPRGKFDDKYLFTTDVNAELSWVISTFSRRWSIEVAFKASKQVMKIQAPQHWCHAQLHQRHPARHDVAAHDRRHGRGEGHAGEFPERPGLFVHGDRQLPPANLPARRRALLPVATGRVREPSRLLDAAVRVARRDGSEVVFWKKGKVSLSIADPEQAIDVQIKGGRDDSEPVTAAGLPGLGTPMAVRAETVESKNISVSVDGIDGWQAVPRAGIPSVLFYCKAPAGFDNGKMPKDAATVVYLDTKQPNASVTYDSSDASVKSKIGHGVWKNAGEIRFTGTGAWRKKRLRSTTRSSADDATGTTSV